MDCGDRSLIGAAVVTTFSSSSNMFEAAVSKFVKAVGRESLIPVPSLDEANRCQPFQVVVKKNRRWFWQSPKYETSPFQLHQLLVPQDEFTDIKISSRKLTNYNKTYEFDINGKTGAKLLSLFDFELDGDDMISVDAKFGEISKSEVDQPALQGQVDTRKLDLKHEFIEQVRTDPRKTLCVIVGTASLVADGDVHMRTNRKGEAKEDVQKVPAAVTDEEVDVSVGDKGDNELLIPKGTPLAFNICELLIKADGKMELMVERNSLGGFDDTDFGDSVDGGYQGKEGILEGMSLDEQFGSILAMKADDRLDLRSSLLNICATPVDIETILKLLKAAQRAGGAEDAAKSGHLKVVGQVADSQHVLQLAGCQVKDDGSVTYPKEATPMLDALRSVFEALIELDDMTVLALRRCTKEHSSALLHLLSSSLDQVALKTTDEQLASIYKAANPAQSFTETLGFTASEDGNVTSTLDNQSEVEGAYRAVFVLWWDGNKSAPGAGFRCTIL